VPAVLAVSVLTFVVWMWHGPEPKLAHAIINAVAVLSNALGLRKVRL
jgi:Cu+-exporting ATPase